jgi:hypothetical protein
MLASGEAVAGLALTASHVAAVEQRRQQPMRGGGTQPGQPPELDHADVGLSLSGRISERLQYGEGAGDGLDGLCGGWHRVILE